MNEIQMYKLKLAQLLMKINKLQAENDQLREDNKEYRAVLARNRERLVTITMDRDAYKKSATEFRTILEKELGTTPLDTTNGKRRIKNLHP